MEKVKVNREEMGHLLLFLEDKIDPEKRYMATMAIQNFLNGVEKENYYQGIDVFSLTDCALLFKEVYTPTILQVEVERNDAVLTIYHGDEDTYGDWESLELWRFELANRAEFNLLEMVKKEIEVTLERGNTL
ncbi:hypothetical protein [Jeotgalibaca caeni]|uniref:hypothetical protein n=1 Tax=Jeotgalibaca caeni TaxID=3028623 RepID=UPI00237D5FEF|nr:hypothetical protein [Jeotgalibaca caeni]MDE1548546.1 hypothetical protein [Jeotgalibaca caeni]